MKRTTKYTLASLLLIAAFTGNTKGSIIVTDNGSTLTATWNETFTLASDMTGGIVHALVYEGVFDSDLTGASSPTILSYDNTVTVEGFDQSTTAWPGWNYRAEGTYDLINPTQMGILWDPTTSGSIGDTVVVSGNMTIDKSTFFRTPQFEATSVWVGSEATQFGTGVIPEPGTLSMMGLGAMAALFARRRFLR